jgi:DNA-directed RNA polymerase specialized sigma subunit
LGVLDDMAERDPLLDQELERLTSTERRWLEEEVGMRRRATELAAELGLDEREVYHQLKQLRRPPLERLRIGLTHGRRRPRISD